MKIIIDGLIYSSAPSGGGYRYFNELITRLSQFPDAEINIYTRKNPTHLPSGTHLKIEQDTLPTGKWLPEGWIKDNLRHVKHALQKQILKRKFSGVQNSIFHSTYYTACPWKKMPQVTTVYDMISEIFPETFELPHIKETREAKSKAIKNASQIIAISETTKRDIQKVYGIQEHLIDVIHLGVDYTFFATKPSEGITQALLSKHHLNSPYFLYVGGRLHHKNFIRLLKGFALSVASRDHNLAVVGTPWNEDEKNLIQSLELQNKISWIPSVPEAELPILYQNAVAFVFPSYYEGFGLPLIEAMAAGCPVVASNAGPFPELAQNAALLFDPFDENKIAQSLEAVLEPATRNRLIPLGKERAKIFSWDRLAEQHYQTYQKVIDKSF